MDGTESIPAFQENLPDVIRVEPEIIEQKAIQIQYPAAPTVAERRARLGLTDMFKGDNIYQMRVGQPKEAPDIFLEDKYNSIDLYLCSFTYHDTKHFIPMGAATGETYDFPVIVDKRLGSAHICLVNDKEDSILEKYYAEFAALVHQKLYGTAPFFSPTFKASFYLHTTPIDAKRKQTFEQVEIVFAKPFYRMGERKAFFYVPAFLQSARFHQDPEPYEAPKAPRERSLSIPYLGQLTEWRNRAKFTQHTLPSRAQEIAMPRCAIEKAAATGLLTYVPPEESGPSEPAV